MVVVVVVGVVVVVVVVGKSYSAFPTWARTGNALQMSKCQNWKLL